MKYEKEINAILDEIVEESGIQYNDKKRALEIIFESTGLTKVVMSDAISEHIGKGESLDVTIDGLKKSIMVLLWFKLN